jgi:hypothetical protein
MDWLEISPASGASSGEHDSLQLQYNTSRLSAGYYTGLISIASPEAAFSPKTVGVILTMNPPPPAIAPSANPIVQSCITGRKRPIRHLK